MNSRYLTAVSIALFGSLFSGCQPHADEPKSPDTANHPAKGKSDPPDAKDKKTIYTLDVRTANELHRHLHQAPIQPNLSFSYCGELSHPMPSKIFIKEIDPIVYYRWKVEYPLNKSVRVTLFSFDTTTTEPADYVASVKVNASKIYILYPTDPQVNNGGYDDDVPNGLKDPTLANVTPRQVIETLFDKRKKGQ